MAAPQRSVDVSAFVDWLMLRSLDRETRRMEAVEADKHEPAAAPAEGPGITGRTELSWNLGVDEVREVFDVNVIGPFLCCKALVPRLLPRLTPAAFPANEKFNAAQRSALEVPIVLAGGDKTAGPTLPRTADSMREHGCANVTVEVIKNSGHFVSEEQPERVADLIEHHASVERK